MQEPRGGKARQADGNQAANTYNAGTAASSRCGTETDTETPSSLHRRRSSARAGDNVGTKPVFRMHAGRKNAAIGARHEPDTWKEEKQHDHRSVAGGGGEFGPGRKRKRC